MNRYLKAIIGAIIGAALAGGWLIVDLLLPDPIGDYLLFIVMGALNAGIGWQVGRTLSKRSKVKEPVNEPKPNPQLSTEK